jgi:undecaprenyl diphosphate synthase
MKLPVDFFSTFVPELIAENVQVKVMGELDALPAHTRKAATDAIADTAANTGMILNFALNYGSRDELVSAVQQISQEVAAKKLAPEAIDEATIAAHLMTAELGPLADPDLLIRTSGEERLSNFLLWQLAYSELVFSQTLWPDFTPATLQAAIAEYQSRDRRFGGLTK